jgi:hypothetical protein
MLIKSSRNIDTLSYIKDISEVLLKIFLLFFLNSCLLCCFDEIIVNISFLLLYILLKHHIFVEKLYLIIFLLILVLNNFYFLIFTFKYSLYVTRVHPNHYLRKKFFYPVSSSSIHRSCFNYKSYRFLF